MKGFWDKKFFIFLSLTTILILIAVLTLKVEAQFTDPNFNQSLIVQIYMLTKTAFGHQTTGWVQ